MVRFVLMLCCILTFFSMQELSYASDVALMDKFSVIKNLSFGYDDNFAVD